ncbi:hypothetical protein IL252_12940 [Halomicrobium sp. IBSBa]|uniref:hypothetical protein n=1 Tax=Halomicrobium sp. IBSBa TaxID=2778916 RepID=UPI001ABEECB1|nr:hypothetical protein [Halomicrobium sp. IBSBa]MBO4248722.1 hypothetical protein [Halomicrobium sp. IBSBa]
MPLLVRGGLRITVDGQRINTYEGETDREWLFDWYPEFVGEIPLITLRELCQTVASILSDEIQLYEPQRIHLPETSDAFVCERIGDEHLRVAFQTPGREANQATPASACGVAVRADEFGTELRRCGDDFEASLDRFGFNGADVESFRNSLEEFRVTLGSQ